MDQDRKDKEAVRVSLHMEGVWIVRKCNTRLITIDDDTDTTDVQDLAPKLKRLKPTPTQAAAPVPQNKPSIIEINDNNDLKNKRLNKSNATANIKEFFVPIPREPGQEKGCMRCKPCE